MTLAAFVLALVAPSLSPSQLPVGPLFGPSGGFMTIVDVELSGTDRWLLGIESSYFFDSRAVVARIDGTGSVSWLPPVPAVLMPEVSTSRLLAVGENRILVRGFGNAYRTLIATTQGWQEELMLTPINSGVSIFGTSGDISGSTVLFNLPAFHAQPMVIDPTLGAVGEEIPTSPTAFLPQIAVDGETVIALETRYPFQTLSVFRRVGGSWTRVDEIESPVGTGWRGGLREFAFDEGRVAVATSSVSPLDPCPKLYVFEPDASGHFVLTAEFDAASPCATSELAGVGYSNIQLVGTELAAIEGLDRRADRFERTAQGWVRRERVASDGPTARAWPFGGQLVGNSLGSEVFGPVDSPGSTQITCATPSPVVSTLRRSSRTEITASPFQLVWTVAAAPTGTPYFLAVGFEPGSRPLGATAELCIGGLVSVVPMGLDTQGPTIDVPWVEIDPIAAGLPPGGTLHVQAWRPDPVTPGGLTSNALSILFAP